MQQVRMWSLLPPRCSVIAIRDHGHWSYTALRCVVPKRLNNCRAPVYEAQFLSSLLYFSSRSYLLGFRLVLICLFIIWMLSVGCRHSTLRSLIRECKWYWLFGLCFQRAEKAPVFLDEILSKYDDCNQDVRLISGCDIYQNSCLYRSPLGECKQCFLFSSHSHFEITFPTALASHCVKATLSLRTFFPLLHCDKNMLPTPLWVLFVCRCTSGFCAASLTQTCWFVCLMCGWKNLWQGEYEGLSTSVWT